MSRVFLSFFERIYSLRESNFIKDSFLKAVQVFESYGYDYLYLPILEKHSEQESSIGERSKESLTFRDTVSGELISLRRDFTTLAIRTLVSSRELDFPKRVFYFGRIVSTGEEGYESYQTGIELMGVKSVEGDAEVISAVVDYLQTLGVENLSVSVSHVGIHRKVLANCDARDREALRRALLERNITYLRGRFSDGFFAELPLQSGGKEILARLREHGFEREARELESLGEFLRERGVDFTYDLGEVKDLPYYTGIVFEIHAEGMSFPVASGGRYDRLSELFGMSFPGAGGAVYIDRLQSLLGGKLQAKDFFLIDTSKEKRLGYRVANLLREYGYRVGRDLVSRSLEHSLLYAFKSGFSKALVLRDDDRIILYTTPKDSEAMSLKEFLETIKQP